MEDMVACSRASGLGRVVRVAIRLLVIAVLAAAAVACSLLFRQDLRIVDGPRGSFIDVQWLGEYQANVRDLRLTDVQTGEVVWEVRARDRFFPLWLVEIKPGENSASPDAITGEEVLVPRGPTFKLVEAKRYRVDLWSYKEGLRRHVTEEFVLPKRVGA